MIETGIIVAIIALCALGIITVIALEGRREFGSFTLFKDRVISFVSPNRAELLLLWLYAFTFFVADLAQNKFLDLGIGYQVIVFWNTTALAYDVWQVFLILSHIFLVLLFVKSIESKKTHKSYDTIAGMAALFGTGILLAGAIIQIFLSDPADTFRFLTVQMRPIDFYHIGVYIQMLYATYLAFTG